MKINSNTILLEKEAYQKIEKIIKKIALENDVKNVEAVEIHVDPHGSIAKFKIKEAGWGSLLAGLGIAGGLWGLSSWLGSEYGVGLGDIASTLLSKGTTGVMEDPNMAKILSDVKEKLGLGSDEEAAEAIKEMSEEEGMSQKLTPEEEYAVQEGYWDGEEESEKEEEEIPVP